MASQANQRPSMIVTRPISPAIGAEIEGVDLRQPISDETLAEIRAVLLSHKVIFFRDADITTEQHIAFARRFGDLEIHPMTAPGQANPEVLHLKRDANRKGEENMWHSDVTWRAEPSLGSILRARLVPDVGGDTLFADMVAAYEGLSSAMQEWVCTLTAVHDGSGFAVMQGKPRASFYELYPPQEHPVVRTHPETGAKALYVNTAFTTHIKGLSTKESDWLLQHLYAQAAIPEVQCRFRWRENSIAFWDNRACQHYAAQDYFPAKRHMERVTIKGDKPFYRP